MDEFTRERELDGNGKDKENYNLVERSLELSEEKNPPGLLKKVIYLMLIIFIGVSIVVLAGLFISDFTNKDPLISQF